MNQVTREMAFAKLSQR